MDAWMDGWMRRMSTDDRYALENETPFERTPSHLPCPCTDFTMLIQKQNRKLIYETLFRGKKAEQRAQDEKALADNLTLDTLRY